MKICAGILNLSSRSLSFRYRKDAPDYYTNRMTALATVSLSEEVTIRRVLVPTSGEPRITKSVASSAKKRGRAGIHTAYPLLLP